MEKEFNKDRTINIGGIDVNLGSDEFWAEYEKAEAEKRGITIDEFREQCKDQTVLTEDLEKYIEE